MFESGKAAPVGLSECIKQLQVPAMRLGTELRAGLSSAILNDDCENAAQAVMRMGDGLTDLVEDSPTPMKLSAAMIDLAHGHPLFEGLTREHHEKMGACLHRLGSLLKAGKWSLALAVVSAKGASYSEANPTPTQLSGHGTIVSRFTDESGNFQYVPCEGTSYIACDAPPAADRATKIDLKLADGGIKTCDLAVTPTLFAQNISELCALSSKCRLLGHLCDRYDNPTLQTPFYVSMFYSGLQQGTSTFGCVPLDASEGTVPTFGAPMLGLGRETSIAIPLDPSFLNADHTKAGEIMRLVRLQANEIYPPPATREQVHALMSRWQPCASPDEACASSIDPSTHMRAECTSAFDDPNHTRAAVQVYQSLAARFNELQAADPADDHVRAHGFGSFLSAALRLSIPIPPASQPTFHSTTMTNMRAAVNDIGIQSLVVHADKAKHIQAQAAIQTEHPFFMCQMGGGLVHSHSVKLA